MKYEPSTRVESVAAICQSSPEAVKAAAKIYGYPVAGNLILKSAIRIPDGFCSEVRLQNRMIQAQRERQAA